MMLAIAVAGHTTAAAHGNTHDSAITTTPTVSTELPAPTASVDEQEDVLGPSPGRNWFVSVSAGAEVFSGSPIGCEDLFGRTQPAIQATAGKWLTPAFGIRVAYQGFGLKFTDAAITDHGYHNVHADLMWNIIGRNRNDELGLHRWTVAPYVGGGVIHHADNDKTSFAFNYGVMAAYRLNKRLSVNMEFAGLNTFQRFDGIGKNHRLGDQMFSLTAGLTLNIGKVGWKHAEKTTPYRPQDKCTKECIDEPTQTDDSSIPDFTPATQADVHGQADYSGIVSLKARLAHKDWDGKGSAPHDSIAGQTADGRKLIGVPYYFFFNINSCDLTDVSQLQNLTNLARVATSYHLKVYVEGAADSATGTKSINNTLSKARAEYIARLLREKGVAEEDIIITAKGGINRFSPIERNRYTRVMVSSPKE